MKIGVIGNGIVGHATGEALRNKGAHDVKYFDVRLDKSDVKSIKELVEWAQGIVSVIPTNNDEVGRQDLRGVQEVVRQTREAMNGHPLKIFVQRSTVLPGTTRMIADALDGVTVIYSPSFLYRSIAMQYEENPEKIVIGLASAEDKGAALGLWHWLPEEKFFFGSYVDAELAKYISNNTQSVIMSFLNEVYQLAEGLGVDDKWLIETMVAEKSAASMYRIFGKAYGPGRMRDDMQALMSWARDRGLWPVLEQSAQAVNTIMEKKYGVQTTPTSELMKLRDFRKMSANLKKEEKA